MLSHEVCSKDYPMGLSVTLTRDSSLICKVQLHCDRYWMHPECFT